MLDPALAASLAEVTSEMGQPPQVAQRLAAWLKALSEGDPSREENLQFLDGVRQAVRLEAGDAD